MLSSRVCVLVASISLVASLVAVSAQSGQREPVKIRAAFFSGSTLYLFGDNCDVLSVSSNGTIILYHQDLFGVPADYNMTAAVYERSHWGVPVFIFFAEGTIYYGHILDYQMERGQFAMRFPDFLWHGIDAATAEGDVAYYLQGCEYITRDANGDWDTTPRNVSDLSVPCDVDAAWDDGSDTYVLKGNKVWTMFGDIDDPMDLDEYIEQDMWEIQDEDDQQLAG